MATYYIDSNVTYASTVGNDGQGPSTPWGAPGGLQRALAAVVAGETIYCRRGTTVDISKLLKITHAAVTGGFAAGDYVYETSDTANPPTIADTPGQGYVAWVESTTVTWLEVTSGTWNTTASRYIYKDATNYSGAISAVATPGPTTKTAGTVGSPVSVIGCANDAPWTVDGTRFAMTGASATGTSGVNVVHAYYVIRNISATLMLSNGFVGTGAMHAQFYNCLATNCGTGFTLSQFCIAVGCQASSCTGSGFALTADTKVFYSIANLNATGISGLTYDCDVVCCIVSKNATGITSTTAYRSLVWGCVIDGQTANGITGSSVGLTVFANRITNNGDAANEYGINCATNVGLVEDYNLFYNNGSTGTNHRNNVNTGLNSVSATTVAQAGYTNQGTGNYNLLTTGLLRRSAVTLADAVNAFNATAGPPPADWTVPVVGDVKLAVTYKDGTLTGTYTGGVFVIED